MKNCLALLVCCLALGGAEEPVALYPGLGNWTHPIATANPDAQKYFDQGLALLYGFNRPRALRSFRKAAELDPKAAMAQWGISMSLGPYINMDLDPDIHLAESCVAANNGLQMAPPSEKAWLDAAAARCPDYSDPAKYTAGARTLAQVRPDDPDAQTIYAEALLLAVRWRWYTPDKKPATGVAEAEQILEATLRRFPNHIGANHLYIHAVESSPTPERAIPSSYRLMGLAPSAGHLIHMPGHIWLVTGDYRTAVDVNERAAQTDREYFAKTGEMGSYYMYYMHNLQFILYGQSMRGRTADTKQAIAQIQEAAKPLAHMAPEMADVFDVLGTLTRLRVNLWDEVLAIPKPASASPLTQSIWHFARTVSLAGKGNMEQARTERTAFESFRAKVEASIPWGNNKVGPVMDLASESLAARVESSPAASIPHWKNSLQKRQATQYRVFSYAAALERMRARERTHVVRIVSGVFFVLPLSTPVDRLSAPVTKAGVDTLTTTVAKPATPVATSLSTPVATATPSLDINLGMTTSSEVRDIAQTLRKTIGAVDDDVARRLITECRRRAPDASVDEIGEFLQQKARFATHNPQIRNPSGFLLTAVPLCFEGESSRIFRQSREEAKREEKAEMERIAKAILDDPDSSDEDRRWSRGVLDNSSIHENAERPPQ